MKTSLKTGTTRWVWNSIFTQRQGKTAGGIALVYHCNLSVEIKQNDDFHPRTVETTWYKVKCGNTSLNIHVIYRPLNGSVIDFCEEMTTLLETTILDVNKPIFCGDFNMHAEDISNSDTIIFYDFLDSFNPHKQNQLLHTQIRTYIGPGVSWQKFEARLYVETGTYDHWS